MLMKFTRSIKFLAAIAVGICSIANAQIPGDEDREMFNKGKQRDQQAIDEAH